jgi:hypothetical protein
MNRFSPCVSYRRVPLGGAVGSFARPHTGPVREDDWPLTNESWEREVQRLAKRESDFE